jgi:hypothetical protein
MAVSRASANPWQRAATTSVLWHALGPVRRIWMLAEAAVSRVSAKCDAESPSSIANIEARTVSIVRSSLLFHLADRMLKRALAAWSDSAVGAASRHIRDRMQGRTLAETLRLGGGLTVAASATALALQRLGTRPAPLTWILPALGLLVGACLLASARASAER